MAPDSEADHRRAPAAWSRARARRGARAPGAAVGVRQGRGSSSSRAACASSAWRSSRPAAPRASSPAPGSQVRAIEDFTGFPEIMDGRVKTLHPRLYAGLLARRDDERAPARRRRAGDRAGRPRVREPLPVRADRRARRRRARRRSIENIDIGGPTMIRAAAKNSDFAAVVVDPADYERVLEELRESRRAPVAATRARGWRPRRSRAPPATTPRSRRWFAARDLRGLPADAGARPTRR